MSRHSVSAILPTLEMPVWVEDTDPPAALAPEWADYGTGLGPFKPNRLPPMGQVYARRIEHAARHFPKPRKGSLAKWARSVAREVGDFFVGAFQPIREAV